ncbi:MAG: protease complex subunit PrcB family protein [Lachnospiraceae bacterium]|nr:protease complex subunit PrcB family protein [Lachnospiraceae bacterium]MDD7178223.1 protease complex subunit PrcB family protein [bacterium]MDY5518659.1 protease complex subunit PrcB family protein [Lachnospiraceae bacterium]
MKNMKKKRMVLLAGLLACLFAGCSIETGERQKLSEPEYTLVAQEDIPQELMEQIEAEKTEDMKLTYADDGALYIVRGYGPQPGGSSIQVLELYYTDDGIVFDTQLVGGGENTGDETTSAYPYIVVKLLCGEQNVVFE